jgi:hypothetical protein
MRALLDAPLVFTMASTIFKADPAAAVFELLPSSSQPISHSEDSEPHPLAWSFRLLDLLLSISRQALSSTLRRLAPLQALQLTLAQADADALLSLRRLAHTLTASQQMVQHSLAVLTALSDSSLQVSLRFFA